MTGDGAFVLVVSSGRIDRYGRALPWRKHLRHDVEIRNREIMRRLSLVRYRDGEFLVGRAGKRLGAPGNVNGVDREVGFTATGCRGRFRRGRCLATRSRFGRGG